MNCNNEHIPTKSANKEVSLYIKKAVNYKLRPGLIMYKKSELKLVFIEISQRSSEHCSRMHV